MLTRLLLGATGGGSFALHPELGRWARQGVVFTAPSWTSIGILEPTVMNFGPTDWRMWFRSGGLHGSGTNPYKVGYATSTDGISWTDSGAPILGNGTGGEANRIICPHPRKFGSTFYIYYTDVDDAKVQIAASATGYDSFSLTDSGLSLPTGTTQFGNPHVIKLGSTYHMFIDAYVVADDFWGTFYATSSSPTSGFSWAHSGTLITTLGIDPVGTYGSVYMVPGQESIGGLYRAWYQADPDPGNAATDIYRASSSDLITWTPELVLERLGTDYEIDQVADPCVIEVTGKSYMYYDADETATGTCVIKLATISAPLSSVVAA
jgi:hypothetical protein